MKGTREGTREGTPTPSLPVGKEAEGEQLRDARGATRRAIGRPMDRKDEESTRADPAGAHAARAHHGLRRRRGEKGSALFVHEGEEALARVGREGGGVGLLELVLAPEDRGQDHHVASA